MNRVIKLMPDYECYSTWASEDGGVFENTNPDELTISANLKERIDIWEDRYESTFNKENPIVSGFKDLESKFQFEKEGVAIWKDLLKELAGDEVVFFSLRERRVYNYLDYPYHE